MKKIAFLGIAVLAIVISFVTCDNKSTTVPEIAEIAEIDYPEMVEITGGTFTMGNNATPVGTYGSGAGREAPAHSVTVDAFYMGKYQVTQAQYKDVMGSKTFAFTGNNLPAINVSWYDAVDFCNKLSVLEGLTPAYTINTTIGSDSNNSANEANDPYKYLVTLNISANGYRLPTEAEWEYACRAGTTTLYNTGNSITASQAKFNSSAPVAVGSFAPNSLGLFDMHGNVFEWCKDWYSAAYYNTSTRGNPPGPSSGENRVVRGGAWDSTADELRSASRDSSLQSSGYNNVGFRVIRTKYPDGIP